MKIEVPTEYDSVIIATHYLPPRCQDGLITDVLQDVASSHQPYYFIGDLNASAQVLRDRWTNDRGRMLAAYVQNHRVEHVTYFNTYFGSNGRRGKPDKIITRTRSYLNTLIERGPSTSRDQSSIIMTISVKPIAVPIKPRYSPKQADWEA